MFAKTNQHTYYISLKSWRYVYKLKKGGIMSWTITKLDKCQTMN